MQVYELCPPSLIYLIFSVTQIIIDLFEGLYNTAIIKFFVMIMVTLLLNALCQQGLSIISWFIVFIPFIFMTVIVTMLLYVFGLDVASGKMKLYCENNNLKSYSDLHKKTIVNPNYNQNSLHHNALLIVPNKSSSPEYQS